MRSATHLPSGRWLLLGAAALVLSCLGARGADAQTCFWYSDNVNANTPIRCVQKHDSSADCAWDPDGPFGPQPPGQDCTTVEAASSQTVLEMHSIWHECFGGTGGTTPPAGRGQRWYAFHRQFEYDFNIWRDANGYDLIEQHDWCPGMNLPVAHDGAGLPAPPAVGSHPDGCGTGPGRPADVPCDVCVAFPQCMFIGGGAGPASCPAAASPSCSVTGLSFPHTALEQFPNVDDVAKLLDARFHGIMHGAIWIADLDPECNGSTSDPDCIYNGDTLTSSCSPRDPMFWRLHKALDDVVRAWQDFQAVDLMIVIDRSGSMSDPDPTGVSKLEAAVRASEYFAALMDNAFESGDHRIGLVTYSGSATQKLPLTPVVPGLTDAGGAFANAIAAIRSDGTGGCTSIGAGIEKALEALCPNGGDCRLNPQPAPAGTNARKAILLLTDGIENVQPCLESAGASGPTCGSQCFGSSVDYDEIDFTQFVGVGFGSGSSLNGDLLTLLAERQGGIYVQNPGAPGDDLKYFFTMAFGQLTDEFIFVDPRGTLAANDLVSPPIEYTSCADEAKITFTSGWHDRIAPGDLRLVVNRPDGDLVRAGQPEVQASTAALWAYQRIEGPGAAGLGTWRGHLIRPHHQYYNGFAPDAFAKPAEGEAIVRREIQRLCPDGCKRVLLYERGVDPDRSAYRAAVKRELETGLLGDVVEAADPGELEELLRSSAWDLIVYAATGGAPEPYDPVLAGLLCERQRAIVTDLRPNAAGNVLECAGAGLTGRDDWQVIEGDGRLFEGRVKLGAGLAPAANRGFALGPAVQATAHGGRTGAIVARGEAGIEHEWFVDVLGRGLGRISPVPMRFHWATGDELRVAARILPSYHRAGGWDHVEARVEVTYPVESLGTLLARKGLDVVDPRRGEESDARAAALAGVVVPTKTAVFPMYDDGTHGDVNPGNGHWTATLTGLGAVDGTYKLRYVFDLTAAGCTTRREASQDIYVDLRVDPQASKPRTSPRDDGSLVVTLRPRDLYGNLWGPGRPAAASCLPEGACKVSEILDQGDGTYQVVVGVRGAAPGVRLAAFGTELDLDVDCDGCPRLEALKLAGAEVDEHSTLDGKVVLTEGKAPRGGTVVFLESSNPRVAQVPDSVTVPAGERSAGFEVTVLHAHQGPEQVEISAHLGTRVATRPVFVRPIDKKAVGPFVLPDDAYILMSHEAHSE